MNRASSRPVRTGGNPASHTIGMEFKVICGCGNPYRFEMELDGGKVPDGVICPICGLSGSAIANAMLFRQREALPAESRPKGQALLALKLVCPCEAKFKFDLEPAGGKVAEPIHCPVCQQDNTAAANELLASLLAGVNVPLSAVEKTGQTIFMEKPAAAPAATPPSTAPATQTARTGSLPAKPPAPSAARTTDSPPARRPEQKPAAATKEPAAKTGKPVGKPARESKAVPRKEPAARPARKPGAANPVMAAVGAAIGGVLSAVLWYFLVVGTGSAMPWLALIAGGVIGGLARLMGRAASDNAAAAAALVCLVVTIATMGLAAKRALGAKFEHLASAAYDAERSAAMLVANATNDLAIKMVISRNSADPEPNAANVTDAEVERYKQTELPRMVALANGKPTRDQYARQYVAARGSAFSFTKAWQQAYGMLGIMWLMFGAGVAFLVAGRT